MSLKIKLAACLLLATRSAGAQDVRIGVLGLFRPHAHHAESRTRAGLDGSGGFVQAGKKSFVLERSSGTDTAEITVSGDDVALSDRQSVAPDV